MTLQEELQDIDSKLQMKRAELAELQKSKSEGTNIDYRKLERLLLPYDQELSMKYGALADKAEERSLKYQKKDEDAKRYLKEVAAEFVNINPNDQDSWTSSRNNWLRLNEKLADYIPEAASQDAWDRIQTQGGFAKNVAPKGQFAKEKAIEDKIKQATWLSQSARASGNYSVANNEANRAIKLQAELDALRSETTLIKTENVDNVLLRYKNDIDALIKTTTKDRTPDTTELFSTISNDIGEGPLLSEVKSSIESQLTKEKAAKGGIQEYSDAQQKKKADDQADLVKFVREARRKIDAAESLYNSEIKNGAAALAAKALQGDVLAEAEFGRYGAGTTFNQLINNAKSKIGLARETAPEVVKNLINSLIQIHNKEAKTYLDVMKNNKYASGDVKIKPEFTGIKPPTEYPKYDFNTFKKYDKGTILQGSRGLLEVYIDKDGNKTVRKYTK